jgi:iron complex transport system permease protein
VVLAGAGLAVSGAVFQGTFRNPLVSESILGVSSGAGFGAALGIMLGQTSYAIQLFAFVSALAAVGITYLIGRVHRSSPVLLLVLGGIIVGSLFSAFTSLIKYVADPLDKLPSIVFWLLGSFASITIDDIYLVAPGIVVCTIILLLLRWRLNVLSMGDEEAKALGVDAKKLRAVVIVCATIITAGVVCISGLIGWVGLIIPQMCRLIVGPNHKYLVPASILVGAQFLLFVDLICRTITPGEIPISIVTSIVGAPIFLYLLSKVKRGWV